MRKLALLLVIVTMTACQKEQKTLITRSDITLASDTLTPEALWAMGRIGTYAVSPDGTRVANQVTYYSVEENRSNTLLYVQDLPSPESSSAPSETAAGSANTNPAPSETVAGSVPGGLPGGASPSPLGLGSSPAWLGDDQLAFLCEGDIWTMRPDGSARKQLTKTDGAVEDFLFSPDQQKVILVKHVPFHDIIQERPADLPKSTGMVITDLMYRHWDHYVDAIPHPFLLDIDSGKEFDILEGQPFECPMEPFGGIEQLAWSPDSKLIAFTCRTKKGLAYSISTDSDIFLYDVEAATTTSPQEALAAAINLCKEDLTYSELTDGSDLLPIVSPATSAASPAAATSAASTSAAAATTAATAAATAAAAAVPSASAEGPSPADARPRNPPQSRKEQPVNAPEFLTLFPGYDQNPKFSPDGRYIAWLSMARDGYESDRQRLCVCDLQSPDPETGAGRHRFFVTEDFDSSVDDFVWGADSRTLYYIGVWHATVNLYRTNLEGQVTQLTADQADWGNLQLVVPPLSSPEGETDVKSSNSASTEAPSGAVGGGEATTLLMERHDYFHPADLYLVTALGDSIAEVSRLTHENDHILSQLAPGSSEPRWCKTTDNQDLLYWVIKPPHFDPSKKYPTLLFCEGGPQSPVSQFWSYRWNFYIMASQGYVIIAPNRRGLPGFGQEWLEEISGDWTGQCMKDYLSAIDDACDNLPFVDRDRLGAVGASFGGFSVYYLAGHHDKRFKCFIAHDGAFNLEAMYTETEENWFSNWEYEDAYWNRDRSANADRTYKNSPHQFVDQWDTPILCIHGEKDYRINATQGMSAFNAARMRGIPAELLLYPDENHWVLKPQNGILWQRTYFDWLARWLK